MICLSADAGDALGSVLVWNILEGIILHCLAGSGDPVDAVCWLGEDIVAASGVAGSVHIWDLAESTAEDGTTQPPTGSLPGNAGAPGPATLQHCCLRCLADANVSKAIHTL